MKTLGFLGAGAHGRHHMKEFSRLGGVRLAAVHDPDPSAMSAAGKDFAGIRLCPDRDSLLSIQEIDAVVVATPAETHTELVQACLAAGKHVLVEKPLSHTPESAHAMVLSAESHPDQIVLVGHAERHNRAYLDCRQSIQDGLLGEVRFLAASRLSPLALNNPDWVLGPLDTAVHDIDIMLWLTGKLPEKVFARAVSAGDAAGPCDTVAYTMELAGGVLAQGFISWVDFGPSYPMPRNAHPRLFLHGTGGSLQVDLWQRPVRVDSRIGGRNFYADDVLVGYGPYATQMTAQARHFLACLEGTETPLCTPREAMIALAATHAAHESRLNSGGLVVPFTGVVL